MTEDLEHLRVLATLHFVLGSVTGFVATLPLPSIILGVMLHGDASLDATPFDRLVGTVFVVLGSIWMISGWGLAVSTFVAARFLAVQTHYRYCLVVAGLEMILVPLGTILGVFTIQTLLKDTVKPLFQPENR